MDKDVARHVIKASYRSFGELTNLIHLLKAHCEPGEYETFAKAIAAVGFEINAQLQKKIYALYPDLDEETESKIKKYGTLI